jgi:hypothetical protein
MIKKNYEKAAKIVRKMKETDFTGAMEDAFVELFQDDNPRFDEERFRFACNREIK